MSTQAAETNIEQTAQAASDVQADGNPLVRDVRTLLLCKVNVHFARTSSKNENAGDHGQVYRGCYNGIYSGTVDRQCRQYITYGNFDAVSIYKTAETNGADWLQGVRKDSLEIAKQISSERCYLPIHLVTYQASASPFWEETDSDPVCLTSLVYGVRRSNDPTTHCPDVLLTRQITNLLRTYPLPEGSYVKFFVYQAINICDAVVFWMTNDINAALNLSAELARKGIARKTFSLMGLNQSIMLQEHAQSALDILLTILQDHDEDYQVRIHGSIRDHEKAKTCFLGEQESMLRTWISVPPRSGKMPVTSAVCVFGNDDFTIDIQKLGLKQLLSLTFGMLENSLEISLACWEIHTEFTLSSKYAAEHIEHTQLQHPIHTALKQYLDLYRDCFSLKDKRYPWASSYLELLATHVNIDYDPILHAPASLFLGLVRISNEYFQRAAEEPEEGRYHTLLDNSSTAIQRTIRHWSQLTDQLTQADDLVFHGIGNDPAIYEMIPESLLEFYHEYLCKLVTSIVDLGDQHNPGWTDGEYDFDFLLVPDQNQNPRISKMFNVTSLHDKLLTEVCSGETCNTCKNRNKCPRNSSWPEKQVYLVEFQTDLLYDPTSFLFPILHECFHNFGDRYRMRNIRADCLSAIISTVIQGELGLDGPEYKELGKYLKDGLAIQRVEGLNLSRTMTELYQNWKELILGGTDGTVEAQYNKMKQKIYDHFYLDSAEVYSKWRRIGAAFSDYQPTIWNKTLSKWAYYFKECYADLMALLWLELPITSYLRLLEQDWNISMGNSKVESAEAWRYIQRTALVIGVYLFDREPASAESGTGADSGKEDPGYTEDELNDLWEEKQIDKRFLEVGSGGFISFFKKKIKDTVFRMYVNGYLSCGGNPKYGDYPDQLNLVRSYLDEVKNTFILQLQNDASAKSRIKAIRDDYAMYFKDGKQFAEAFNATLED